MLQRLKSGTLTWLTGESGTARKELNIQIGGCLQDYLLLNTAPEHVKLHLYQYPPSRTHLFNHGCLHSHPYSPNVKLGKNGQPQTLKMSVCLV